MKRRFLSFALAIAMCISVVPASVFASSPTDANTDITESKTETTNNEAETNLEGEDANDKEETNLEGEDANDKEETNLEGEDAIDNEETNLEGEDAIDNEKTNLEGEDTNNNTNVPVLLANAGPGVYDSGTSSGIAINEVNFPDVDFRYFVETNFDNDKNKVLSQGEIEYVYEINCSQNTTKSVKGIEYFTELQDFSCFLSDLESVDLSKNTKLSSLDLGDNRRLTELDLSNNELLQFIYLGNTGITTLDISNLLYLDQLVLNFADKDITLIIPPTGIDLSVLRAFTNSTSVAIYEQEISSLKGGKLEKGKFTFDENSDTITFMYKRNTITLRKPVSSAMITFKVVNGTWSDGTTANKTVKVELTDGVGTLPQSEVPTGMIPYEGYRNGKWDVTPDTTKDAVTRSVIYTYAFSSQSGASIDSTNFPDSIFREYASLFDMDGDGVLTEKECEAADYIDLAEFGISSLKGIEYFTDIIRLQCYLNNLEQVDLSQNTMLTYLDIGDNPNLTELDLSNNPLISRLYISNTGITTLDVSHQPNLAEFVSNFSTKDITLIIGSSHFKLITLRDFGPQGNHVINNGEVSEVTGGKFENGEFTFNENSDTITFKYKEHTTTLKKSASLPPVPATAKVTFKIEHGKWSDGTTADKVVEVALTEGVGTLPQNKVPTGMTANEGYENGAWDMTPDTTEDGITEDVTYTYNFTAKPVITKTADVTFKVVNGKWSDGTTADKVVEVTLTDNKGTLSQSKVPTGMTANEGYENGAWDMTPNITEDGITEDVTYTYTFKEKAVKESIAINSTNFPDANFRNYIAEWLDDNGDKALSPEELSGATSLACARGEIKSLKGVEYLTDLVSVTCCINDLDSLDLSKNSKITFLDAGDNPRLKELDLSKNMLIRDLYLSNTGITTLDISNLSDLAKFAINFWESDITLIIPSSGIGLSILRNSVNGISRELTPSDISEITGGKLVNGILTFDENSDTITFKYDNHTITLKKPGSAPQPPVTTTADVTFKVVNGKWADSTTADKVVEVTLTDGKGTLSQSKVPTGMTANAGYENGAWDVTPNITANAITGNVTYTYTFKEKAPVTTTADVTFKVVNGKWADGSTADKVVEVTLTEGVGTLSQSKVPTGMTANAGYENGAWDVTPDITADAITGDVTYTYTFKEKAPVTTTADVTFKVVNGKWADGSTADKVVEVTLTDGKGTLSQSKVPTGMTANAGYENGAWDVTPNITADAITGDVTYIYTFSEKTSVITKAKVTLRVDGGTWADGSTADKVVEVTLTNGRGKLTNEQIPTGMKPDENHKSGSWFLEVSEGVAQNKTPYEEEITGDCAFVYVFSLKDILEATPDSLVGGGEVILKTNKQFLKCDDESIVLERIDGDNNYVYYKAVLPDVTKDYVFTASDDPYYEENLTVTVHVTKSGEPDPERPDPDRPDPERPRPRPDNDDRDDENESSKKPVIIRPSVVITPSMNPPTGASL